MLAASPLRVLTGKNKSTVFAVASKDLTDRLKKIYIKMLHEMWWCAKPADFAQVGKEVALLSQTGNRQCEGRGREGDEEQDQSRTHTESKRGWSEDERSSFSHQLSTLQLFIYCTPTAIRLHKSRCVWYCVMAWHDLWHGKTWYMSSHEIKLDYFPTFLHFYNGCNHFGGLLCGRLIWNMFYSEGRETNLATPSLQNRLLPL